MNALERIGVSVAVALAGCGAGEPPLVMATAGSSPSATSAPTAAPPAVTITDLTFYLGDEVAFVLRPDGTIATRAMGSDATKPGAEQWHVAGQLAVDGTLTHGGKVVGQLHSDGTFRRTNDDGPRNAEEGRMLGFKLDGATLVVGGKRLTIDDEGLLQNGNPAIRIRVTGATEPGSRRTALLLLAMMAPPVTFFVGPATQ